MGHPTREPDAPRRAEMTWYVAIARSDTDRPVDDAVVTTAPRRSSDMRHAGEHATQDRDAP